LDVHDITYVINFDFPKSIDDYIHRIGRTARAGAYGTSISFLTNDDRRHGRDLIKLLEEAKQQIPHEILQW